MADAGSELSNNRVGKLTRRHSDFGVLVFEMIAYPMVLLDGDRIFCRVHTKLFQPFRVHVETSRAILHNSAIPILAFSAQEPIDENFGGIGMRWIVDDAQHTETVASRQPFLRCWRRLDRQACFDERLRLAPADAEGYSDLAFRQNISELPQIPGQEKLLLDQFLEKLFTLDFPHEGPHRLSGARHARIAEANLVSPFGREIVIEGTKFFRLRQARVVPNTMGAHIRQKGIEITIRA